jgi:hypothetical protein
MLQDPEAVYLPSGDNEVTYIFPVCPRIDRYNGGLNGRGVLALAVEYAGGDGYCGTSADWVVQHASSYHPIVSCGASTVGGGHAIGVVRRRIHDSPCFVCRKISVILISSHNESQISWKRTLPFVCCSSIKLIYVLSSYVSGS